MLKLFTKITASHLHLGTMSWHFFHGRGRMHGVTLLGEFDIVITTYKTLSLEWKKHSLSPIAESLLSLLWHRVILDEGESSAELSNGTNIWAAQTIQNQRTSVAQASCALHARHRWAVSGTPIQNKLSDLASIFKFLRVYPFGDPRVFDLEISQPWLRADQQGILRLKTLVNFITLCRTKAVVDLPKRFDQVHLLEFSPEENEIYESAKMRTAQLLDNAIAINYTQRGTYLNALKWLNALRLICNHGVMHSKRGLGQTSMEKAARCSTWSTSSAQTAFQDMLSAGVAICVGCSVDLAEATCDDFNSNTTELPKPRLSECMFLLCGSCLLRCHGDTSMSSACHHVPKCFSMEVSLTSPVSPSQFRKVVPTMKPTEVPTKLRALLTDLGNCNDGEKLYVFRFVIKCPEY